MAGGLNGPEVIARVPGGIRRGLCPPNDNGAGPRPSPIRSPAPLDPPQTPYPARLFPAAALNRATC